MNVEKLSVWELLQKQQTWIQLGKIQGKTILDYGSGNGCMSAHYAADNTVIGIEPDRTVLEENVYDQVEQICGGLDELKAYDDEYFDIIFCHNVFEYAADREEIMSEFARVLKPQGILSVLKHNLPGRVFQMAVLLNDFEMANSLLDGKNGKAEKYGEIKYYQDSDLTIWAPVFCVNKVFGQRTFWDLQQNQQIQKSVEWQKDMLYLEQRVSELEEYKSISFFHHIILSKKI